MSIHLRLSFMRSVRRCLTLLSITLLVSGGLYGVFGGAASLFPTGDIVRVFWAGVLTLFTFGAVLKALRYDFSDTLYGSIGGALFWAGVHLWYVGYVDSTGYPIYPIPLSVGIFCLLLSCGDDIVTDADIKEFRKFQWRRQ